jgi:SAM-dependent methyltransferase
MKPLPPGTILQLMYLRDRLRKLKPGRFIEIGPGSGEISRLLLDLGWVGVSYDLEILTVQRLHKRFYLQIKEKRYDAKNLDFLATDSCNQPKADLIISCMVIEHLNDRLEEEFMHVSSRLLRHDGLMIGLVPASPSHWGIEDDIAGHNRRYTRNSLMELASKTGWCLRHVAGLTYPISNLLLPLSNYLVLSEKSKLKLSRIEKTKASGIRNVRFKTTFPSVLGVFLNEYFLLPLHWIQKAFCASPSALVLYFEASVIRVLHTDTDSSSPRTSLNPVSRS